MASFTFESAFDKDIEASLGSKQNPTDFTYMQRPICTIGFDFREVENSSSRGRCRCCKKRRTGREFSLAIRYFHLINSNLNWGFGVLNVITQNAQAINKKLDYTRDFNYDFFGFKTLEKSYLLRTTNKKVAERPQHMLMRVSIGIH